MTQEDIQIYYDQYRNSLRYVSSKRADGLRLEKFQGLLHLFSSSSRSIISRLRRRPPAEFKSLIRIITLIDQIEPSQLTDRTQENYKILTTLIVALSFISNMFSKINSLSVDHKKLMHKKGKNKTDDLLYALNPLPPESLPSEPLSQEELNQLHFDTFSKASTAFTHLQSNISILNKDDSSYLQTPSVMTQEHLTSLRYSIQTMQETCESKIQAMTGQPTQRYSQESNADMLNAPLLPKLTAP